MEQRRGKEEERRERLVLLFYKVLQGTLTLGQEVKIQPITGHFQANMQRLIKGHAKVTTRSPEGGDRR